MRLLRQVSHPSPALGSCALTVKSSEGRDVLVVAPTGMGKVYFSVHMTDCYDPIPDSYSPEHLLPSPSTSPGCKSGLPFNLLAADR